jgi:predicted KAP-like P-loop ATPase
MLTNDTPITTPDDDHFGIDPFALALAKAISAMQAPQGVVIGINGPWGSGKTSALNLIVYHLESLIQEQKIKVVRFSPWWLSSTEAIIAAFLSDLEAAIGESISKSALNAFRNVAHRVQRVVGAAADLAAPGVGKIVDAVEGLLGDDQSIEAQHRQVSASLANANCRFLVVIDDIDRLAPDDVIEMFKLVKSVGQLSNVIYLLAFDRQLAERVVSNKYPSEGPHYLEKIVQAAFDVPAASEEQLRAAFLAQINNVCPPAESEDQTRFMNLMLECVTPLLRSPRDLSRLMGMLQVTWAAVATEVDRADFVSVEAFRLTLPDLYRAIRANGERLTGIGAMSVDRPARSYASEYDNLLLAGIPESERSRVKRALRRLFPRLDGVWGNVHHTSDSTWRRFRRICTAEHFDTYFRFAIGEEILSATTVAMFINQANDRELIKSTMRRAVDTKLVSGKTRASVYLDELRVHAPDVPRDHIGPLITSLFEIADELDVQSDEGRGFYSSGDDNTRRLNRLVVALLKDRLEQSERITILRAAMQSAQLYWLCSFAESCKVEQDENRNRGLIPADQRFVDLKTSKAFTRLALRRIRAAAKDGSLAGHRRLFTLLWMWSRAAPKGLEEVRAAAQELLRDDDFVLHFASSAAGMSWSYSAGFDGMGDLVSRGRLQVNKDSFSPLVDPLLLLGRVKEVAEKTTKADEAAFFASFLEAWERPDDHF